MAMDRPTDIARTAALVGAALLFAAGEAEATGPEQVEELGPRRGEWLFEYYGQFGDGSPEGRKHSGSSFYGVTDWLALGGETQTRYVSGAEVQDGLRLDFDSAVALLRFSDPEQAAIGSGLWLQAGLDTDGELAQLEARLILEKQSPAFRSRANAMLRRVNQEDEEGSYVAYGATLQYALSERVWLGIEGSGQAFRISGFDREPFEDGHYLGPSLNVEFPIGPEARLDVGLAYFRRLDEGDLRDTARLALQLRF